VWYSFGFYLIWIQNLFLNSFGNKLDEERKEKGKRKSLAAAGGLEAHFTLACSLLFLFPLGRAEPSRRFLSALSRVRVGRPTKLLPPRAFLPYVADERVPSVSRAFFLLPWPSQRPTLPPTKSIENLETS
jgi:hypothetical protein